MTEKTETKPESSDEKKGDRPSQAKVEKKRREREGKTFQQNGIEVRK